MAVTVDTDHARGSATDCSHEVSRLYEAYSDRIFGYCLYRLGNRSEAEDAVQTTFMYVFRSLQRGVEPENESAWLFTIAHNVCRSTRRSTRRRRRVETQQDPQVLQELSPGLERDNDSLLGLEDALSSIPATQRQAILMREWHGMPYREIAATLGVTQTAVEMLVFRARRSLATALDHGSKPARRRIASALNIAGLASMARSFFGGVTAANMTAAAGVAVVAVGIGGSMPTHNAPVHVRAPHVAPTALAAAQQPHAPLAVAPTLSSPTLREAARAATGSLKSATPNAAEAPTPAAPVSSTTSSSDPASATSQPSPQSPPAGVTPTSPPVQSIASQIPAVPSIASSAPPLPPVSVPTTSLPVTLPTVTVPSVTDVANTVGDVANTVGASLPKLP
jgi:RNA polymerase sigma-70 factor, ECF subfamily